MNYYEIPFAVLSEIPLQGIETLKQRIADSLEKHSGKIMYSEYWGIRELAYKVRKQSKARFFVLIVQSGKDFPAEITKYFRLNESILRHAVYKLTEESFNTIKKPSYILSKLLETPEYSSTEEEKAYSNVFQSQSSN